MAVVQPRMEDLPDEFPVFPLAGALLLPRGKLPLRIFEPRYVAMTEDALGQGRMFGMIQPDPTQAETDNGPSLFRIGCLGRLSSFSETDEGHYLITLTGLIRFAVAEEIEMRRGYRRVRGGFARFATDLRLDPQPLGMPRDTLLSALREYFNRRSLEADWDVVRRLPDEMFVVTLSMVCPFEPAEKQALLEAPGEVERAATLLTLLQMGAVARNMPSGRSVS